MQEDVIQKETSPHLSTVGVLPIFKVLRVLEGSFWALLVFYICLIATVKDWTFATFPYLSCVPLFVLIYLAFRFPVEFIVEQKWQDNLRDFKIYSLIAAFNFPFLVFLSKGTVNEYFKWCSIFAVYALFKVLKVFLKMVVYGGGVYGDKSLVQEAKLALILLNISVFILLSLTYLYLKMPIIFTEFTGLEGKFGLVKLLVLILIIFPLIFPITLLFRIRCLVYQDYLTKVERLLCPKQI